MLILISGKSASGKTTLSDELVEKAGYSRLITCTTRAQRPGEPDDAYHFISNETFELALQQDRFLEHEEYSGRRHYGTLKDDVIIASRSENPVVAVVTPAGARAIEGYLREIGEPKPLKILTSAPDGVRVMRSINRFGADVITNAELSEIFERVQRDFGMFQGVEREYDFEIDMNKTSLINAVEKVKEAINKTNLAQEISGDELYPVLE